MNLLMRMGLVFVVCAAILLPGPVLAVQERSVEVNGTVEFYVSLTDVTRLSIAEGRIRRIITDSSAFEMTNDETTGDVFFRFVGTDPSKVVNETGYIVTEKGDTVGYILVPAARVVEPIIVVVKGADHEEIEQTGFAQAGGFGDDIALSLSKAVSEIAGKYVLNRKPKGRDGKVIASAKINGWKVYVLVARAGKTGKLIKPQDYAGEGVRAVWIDKQSLGANEASFVIVVGEK